MAMVNLGEVCRTYIGMQAQYGSRYAKAGPGQSFEGEYPNVLSAEYGDGRVLSTVTEGAFSYHSMQIDESEALEFATRVITYLFDIEHIEREHYEEKIAKIAADRDIDLVARLNW